MGFSFGDFISKIVPNEVKGGGWVQPAATAAGFVLGGPAGAGLGSALGSAARGGDTGDIFKAGALGFGLGSLGNLAMGGFGDFGMGSFGGGLFDNANSLFQSAGGGTVMPTFSSGLPSWATYFAPGETAGMPDWIWKVMKGGLGTGGPLSTAFSLGSGIYGLNRANDMKRIAERASAMQDPFGPYRAGYAGDLRALVTDPSRITSMPGYQAGLDAVERKMAGQGYLGSGNMMAALQKYGGDFFNQEATRLAQLAGAQFAPSGGTALVAGMNSSNDLVRRAMESLGYGVRGTEEIFRRPS